MASNSISISNVQAKANRIAASTTLHEQGGKSANYMQCYDERIEQDEDLVAACDKRGNGTVPVLIFAREDGLTRRTKAQILFTPELIEPFLVDLDDAFHDILSTPTGDPDAPAVSRALKTFANGDLGDVHMATLTNGLHRGLLLVQEQGDELSLPFSHIRHLALGLKAAHQAFVMNANS